MKIAIQNLVMMPAVIMLTLTSCAQKKVAATEKVKTEQAQPVKESISEPDVFKEAETRTVQGTVKEINQGKDGYTAKLETKNKEIYFVTISHSNLTDHNQYKSVKVGEVLKVTGQFSIMDMGKHITVREIN